MNNKGELIPGEGNDEWYLISFQDDDPFGNDFADIAMEICNPMLDKMST